MNEKMYEGIDCSELVEQLKDTDTLHEQADIIHYLYTTKYALTHRMIFTCSLCASLFMTLSVICDITFIN